MPPVLIAARPLSSTALAALLLAHAHAAKEPDDPITAGHAALRKGLHHKAFEHYRAFHKSLGRAAHEHAELQEGLCVCAARLRKEKVAITACENACAPW